MAVFINRTQNGIFILYFLVLLENINLRERHFICLVVRCIKIFISERWKFLVAYIETAALYTGKTKHLS